MNFNKQFCGNYKLQILFLIKKLKALYGANDFKYIPSSVPSQKRNADLVGKAKKISYNKYINQ